MYKRQIIGRLLTKGIDKDKIYRNVFFNYSAERFRLMEMCIRDSYLIEQVQEENE